MKPEEQKIKNIIDKVFDKYKKVLKGTLMWKWEDKTKIANEIIEKVILEFPKLKGKESIIFASLMARFIHTKKNYPFKEFFTIDKAFDVTPESILELIEEETSTFNKYLNIINESKNNNWKNEITNIIDTELLKFEETNDESNEEIKEITNTRIIIEYIYGDDTFYPEIVFKDLEIKLRRPQGYFIEFSSDFKIKEFNKKHTWSKEIPINKAQEIIKIWKNRK